MWWYIESPVELGQDNGNCDCRNEEKDTPTVAEPERILTETQHRQHAAVLSSNQKDILTEENMRPLSTTIRSYDLSFKTLLHLHDL